jgi:hypothetical protein
VARLSRVIDAAEQEMEAALARGAEVWRSQLQARDLELQEARAALGHKERALQELRGTLGATRRGYDARLGELEALAAQRGAEVRGWLLPAAAGAVGSML